MFSLLILLFLHSTCTASTASFEAVLAGNTAPSFPSTNDLIQELVNAKNDIMARFSELEQRLQRKLNSGRPSIINFDYQIFHNLSEPKGWTLIYYEYFSHPTKAEELWNLTQHCSSKIMVGMQENPGSSLYLAATGPVDVLKLNIPINTVVKFGDVWWYLTDEVSFGFAPTGKVFQNFNYPSNYADIEDELVAKRLSWRLNGKIGGRVAGKDSSMNSWRKVIYCV